jgi:nitrate reductase gamma subunit
METVLQWAQGPLFRLAIAIMILGLARHVVLSVTGFVRARQRASKKQLDVGEMASRTFSQANPFRYLMRTRRLYTALTMIMHAGILVVPLFLAGHIVLWEKGLGFGWPHIPMSVADWLTLITIGALVAVIVARLAHPASRSISRVQDWLLPPLLLVIFASGYLIAHPHVDFLPHPTTRLVHVLAGDVILALVPFTKLAHMILLPFSQLAVEMGWRFVPGAGKNVKKTLGKEGQPI